MRGLQCAIGKCAFGVFRKGAGTIGKTIGIAGDFQSGGQMAAALSDALGEPVAYNAVTPEAFRGFGFPGAEDLGNMFQYKAEFNESFCATRDPAVARALNPELLGFRAWLDENKSRLPVESK